MRDRFGAELHLIYVGEKIAGNGPAFRRRAGGAGIAGRFAHLLSGGQSGGSDSDGGGGKQGGTDRGRRAGEGGRLAFVSRQRGPPSRARGALLGHAFHQTGARAEAAAPDGVLRAGLFRARAARLAPRLATRGAGRTARTSTSSAFIPLSTPRARPCGRNQEDGRDQPAARTLEEEEEALEKFIEPRGATRCRIEARCIRSNTGFAASDFVQTVEADLLVVPVEATDGIRRHPGPHRMGDGCDSVQSLDHS